MRRKRTDKPFGGQITTPPPPSWLSPLESDTPPTAETQVKLKDIHLPQQQPRRYFDPQALNELVASVLQHGILQPLLVRPLQNGGYELVAGERRLRAAQEAGLEEVPVVVRQLSDDQAFQLALIENLQREDLNPVEETEGILHLLALRLECDGDAVKSLLYRMKNAIAKGEKQSKTSGEEPRRNVSPNSDESLTTADEGDETDSSMKNVSPNSDESLTTTDEGDSRKEFRTNDSPNSDESLATTDEGDLRKTSRRNVSPNLDEEKSKTVQEVFESLGLMNWLSFTTKRLPLLNLPEEILAALRDGKLEYTKAIALARVKDEEFRQQLLSDTLAHDWSLSEIKEQILAGTSAGSSPSSLTSVQLPDRLKDITQRIRKRRLWEDPKKHKRLETLVSKLEALLGEN